MIRFSVYRGLRKYMCTYIYIERILCTHEGLEKGVLAVSRGRVEKGVGLLRISSTAHLQVIFGGG